MATLELDLEHVRNVAKALMNAAPEVLDRPLGPDENCLSPQQFVTCLEEGVSREQERHLLECQSCIENITELTNVSLKSDHAFVENALRQAQVTQTDNLFSYVETTLRELKERFLPAKLRPVPAFIVLESPVFAVSNATGCNLKFTCDLIPGFERNKLDSIKRNSLRLHGAIKAKQVSSRLIDITQDGIADVLRITFEAGTLDPQIRKAINRGQFVEDTIQLTGTFEDVSKPFLGQARLQFRPTRVDEDLIE